VADRPPAIKPQAVRHGDGPLGPLRRSVMKDVEVDPGRLHKSARRCESRSIRRTSAVPNPDEQNQSRRRSLIALAVVVALFVVSWVLVRALYQGEKLQDCLMSGRTNCAPIEAPPR